ncbi:MAG TPA: NlpC/P60 family protein [Leucothrix mucor]|nr:NlpC/P60 family protein [Leucothrix mucor]
MNIVNWAFTTTSCALVLGFSSSLQATPKHKSINNAALQMAYQELVLNHSAKTQPKYSAHHRQKTRAISIAKRQLKVRYRWGGTSPRRGFDCSGLIQYSFKKANINLPRTAASQYKKTKRIALSQLQSGDLIFFHTRHRRHVRINHVGIYLGNNKFIHAPRRGKTVSITKLSRYWKRKIVGAGRV